MISQRFYQLRFLQIHILSVMRSVPYLIFSNPGRIFYLRFEFLSLRFDI